MSGEVKKMALPASPTQPIGSQRAQRRKVAAANGHSVEHGHPVRLCAPREFERHTGPLLLQRSDEHFLESTLEALRSEAGRRSLQGHQARSRNRDGVLKLYQPIQRQFHVAVVELYCETPGQPRFDPARIEAVGLVLRRLGAGRQPQGWMSREGRLLGWLPLSRIGGADADPLASARLLHGRTGVADLDRHLDAWRRQQDEGRLNEQVIPLYVAPPDICREAGRTLYYGIVPTVSGEQPELQPEDAAPFGADFGPRTSEFLAHLPIALRGHAAALPRPGQLLGADWLKQSFTPGEQAHSDALLELLRLLTQLSGEFDAFGSSEPARQLQQVLAGIELTLPLRSGQSQPERTDAFRFLKAARRCLLLGESGTGPRVPEVWPALEVSVRHALLDALHAALAARAAAQPHPAGRFDDLSARYQLRPFVRLKPQGRCPGRLVWGSASEDFVIAAWYEGAQGPVARIVLPDPGDKGLLASLKPNVSFVVPPSLQSLLSADSKSLLEGKGQSSGAGLTWICSFSLPVITICAFIVLNLFLSLFNLVFGWLASLKICLPFPKPPPRN
jgi:hypothetical protein